MKKYVGLLCIGLVVVWGECDFIIFYLVLGVIMWIIVLLLEFKKIDLGVVVVDEVGCFVILLVGGYVGGVNEFFCIVVEVFSGIVVVFIVIDFFGVLVFD